MIFAIVLAIMVLTSSNPFKRKKLFFAAVATLLWNALQLALLFAKPW